jgi:hypothetical protein
MKRPSGPARTFGWPLALALLMIAALVAGLVGEGAWDVAAVIALAAPTLLAVWKLAQGLRR